MRNFLLLFFLFFFPFLAPAQNKLIDDLQAELARAVSDSAKADLHCQLSKRYALQDSKKSRQHARQALTLATAADFPAGRARALNLIGQYHLVQGEYDQALRHHYQALKIGEQAGDTALLISSYNYLGIMSGKVKDQDKSLHYYQEAAILARKTKNKAGLGKVLNNLGDLYEAKGEYLKALRYYRQAAAMLKAIPHQRGLPVALLNIGALHLHFSDPEKGLPYLFESYRLDEATRHIMTQVVTLGSIAKIYQALGRPAKALQYARKSFDKALETRSDKKISLAAHFLQELYADRQDYEQAYKYQSIYLQHQNKLEVANQYQVSAEITAKYEIGKKELENQKLKAEKEKQAAEIKSQQTEQVFEIGALLLLLLLLVLLFFSRKRLQATYQALQQANDRRMVQHQEISRQKNEIASQARILQQQNDQLEKHHNFRNKIFTIISHDLRAPFNSVRGLLDLLQSQCLSADEMTNVFGLLGRDIDATAAMLNNLLAWSRAQLKGSNINWQSVNLQQLAADNIHLADAQAALKNIRIRNEVPPHLMAFTDQERLSFVLRNLLANAMKFTFVNGEIKLQAREKDGKVEIAVSDNGQGISPKNIARLFTEERFSTPGTSHEKGTGLGLMLSKEFIETLKGDITVESRLEQGSVFRVLLPSGESPAVALEMAYLAWH